MKKNFFAMVCLFLFLFLILFTSASANEDVDVTVDNKSCKRGELVTVAITLSDEIEVKSGGIKFDYDDTVLRFYEAHWNVDHMVMSTFDTRNNTGVFACNEAQRVSGEVFAITFEVSDTATLGDNVINCEVQLRDATGAEILVTDSEGTVTVLCADSTHVFSVTDEKYLASVATYDSPALYYYSCELCGACGTTTYAVGTALIPVTFDDKVCEQGGVITLYLTLLKAVDVKSGGVAIQFDDTVLEYVESSWSVPGVLMSVFDENNNVGAFACSNASNISDQIFAIKFRVLDYALLGDSTVGCVLQLRDALGNAMTVSNDIGIVTVTCAHSFTMADMTYPASAATCESPALYYYSCEKCGECGTNTYSVGETLEHTWDDGAVVSFPTHLDEGVMLFTCEGCAKTMTETIPKLEQMLGDIDENGTVNSDDAVYLLMHIFYPDVYSIAQNGDFDHNDTLNSDDSVYLLMHVFYPDIYPLFLVLSV